MSMLAEADKTQLHLLWMHRKVTYVTKTGLSKRPRRRCRIRLPEALITHHAAILAVSSSSSASTVLQKPSLELSHSTLLPLPYQQLMIP